MLYFKQTLNIIHYTVIGGFLVLPLDIKFSLVGLYIASLQTLSILTGRILALPPDLQYRRISDWFFAVALPLGILFEGPICTQMIEHHMTYNTANE